MSIYEEYFTLFQGDLVIIYKDNIPKVMNSVNKLLHLCCNYMNRQHKWHFIADKSYMLYNWSPLSGHQDRPTITC